MVGTPGITGVSERQGGQPARSDSFESSPEGYEVSLMAWKMSSVLGKVLVKISEVEEDAKFSKSPVSVIP